jgi:putative transposase
MTPYRQRTSPRLQGYDYAQSGAYFVTICTHNRARLFGEIVDRVMQLNPSGEIAAEQWYAIPEHYPDVDLDMFVVMPNHVHGIVLLTRTGRTGHALSLPDSPAIVGTRHAASSGPDVPKPPTLGNIIGSYKSAVTAQVRAALAKPELIVWQSRYHDHIVRDETGLNRIRHYIANNPALWERDTFFE